MTGPALGPIVGGALTQGFSWRATFYFLAIFIGVCLIGVLTCKDTFRRERSIIYQLALRRMQAQQDTARNSQTSTSMSHTTAVEKDEDGLPKQPTCVELTRQEEMDAKPHANTKDVEAGVSAPEVKHLRLSIRDLNPISPMWMVLRRMNNLAILLCSGTFHSSHVSYQEKLISPRLDVWIRV